MFGKHLFPGLLFCLGAGFILSGCTKEKFDPETFDITTYPIYFRTYINAFIEDAMALDVDLDPLANVQFRMIEEIDGEAIAHCSYDQIVGTGDADHFVEVEWDYWLQSSYAERMRIVYHELGHCALDRVKHRNGHFANEMCVSIMEGGEDSDCYGRSGKIFFCPIYRDYYMRELFQEVTETPDWSTESVDWCYDPPSIWMNVTVMNSTGAALDEIHINLVHPEGEVIYGYTSAIDQQTSVAFDVGDLFAEEEEMHFELNGPGIATQTRVLTYTGQSSLLVLEITP